MKKMIIGIAASLLLASTVGGSAAMRHTLAEDRSDPSAVVAVTDGDWTISGLDAALTYGTSIAMPTASVRVDGKDVAAQAYVKMPNGITVSGESFELTQTGKYTITFYVETSGVLYKTERTFVVDAPFVSVGENSSAQVGTYTGIGSKTNNTGFLLRIADGETVTFNKLIDISSLTSQDVLFSAFVTPDEQGVADCNRIIFTLTDAVDSDCSLTIVADRVVDSDWGDSLTYFKAAGQNQTLTGVEGFGQASEKVHVNNEWGAMIQHSFIGKASNGTTIVPSDNPMAFRYDKENQLLKVKDATITDLDNAKYYKSLWTGFPSGKAKLSVSASGYNSKTANLCITEIFGLDFSETTVTDTSAPEIDILTDYTTMPVGKVGCLYPIPEATAIDDYIGACDVECRVIYGYGTAGAVSIPVEDGKIRANYIGSYTIVYTAQDYYGNKAEKLLPFNIGTSISEIVIEPPVYETSYICGEYVTVQEATASGGSGNIEMTAAVYNGETPVTIQDGAFKVDGVGTWKIVYTATDYTGVQVSESVTFVATASDDMIFSAKPIFPMIMMNGCRYTFEQYYAEKYAESGKTELLCDVKVTDASGTKTIKAGESYTPNVEKSGDKITVRYVTDSAEGASYEIPVVTPRSGNADDGYSLDMTEYFYGDGIKKTATNMDIRLEATKSGDVAWTFANSLLHGNFSLELNPILGMDLFEGLKVTLTDATDPDISVSVVLSKKRNKTYLRCGDASAELVSGFESDKSILLAYNGGEFKVGNASVEVSTTDSGTAFTGFVGDKMYLTVTMLDAEVGAQYGVGGVSLNRMNYITEDFSEPGIVISGNYGGSYDLDSVYEIPKTYASDVLAPNCEVSLTVYTPTNAIATDVNGVKLQNVDAATAYFLKLSEYGQYKIKYTAKETDWFDNTKTMQYMVSVYDNIAPEIRFTGNVVTTGKVGEAYRLPSYVVSDNVTETEQIVHCVYAYGPNGKLTLVEDAIRFQTTGTYVFRVMAMDEFGNTGYTEFSVRVTE